MPTNERTIPTHRISRLGKFASLATRVAGNVIAEGTKQIAHGNKLQARELLLTRQNIVQLTQQLAHLRGAAMKMGQMLSMDAGDFLDPELADILARLRSDAVPMPAKQLSQVMTNALGEQWKSHFLAFKFKPIASASIGQVHQAYSDNGHHLAVKVQYPGIKKSIDSDVDNVGTLLKFVGLIPQSLDYQSLLKEAKIQLHAEADYLREANFAQHYAEVLQDSHEFVVPKIYDKLCSSSVLTMEYIGGKPIETIIESSKTIRNSVMSSLISLFFKELFELKMVQTDPNFANYLFLPESQQIALLDFGATRLYDNKFSHGYRRAFIAILNNDDKSLNDALEQIGFFSRDILLEQRLSIINLIKIACEPLRADKNYDFKNSNLPQRLKEAGTILSMQQNYWHTPPIDALFLHRKIGGLYLLAARVEAKINIHQLALPHL